jgi:hypothetical protein
MIKMDIQRGKVGMISQQFNQQLGATPEITQMLLLDTIENLQAWSKGSYLVW